MLQQKKIISLICHHYLSYDFYAGKQEQFITDIQNNRKIDSLHANIVKISTHKYDPH